MPSSVNPYVEARTFLGKHRSITHCGPEGQPGLTFRMVKLPPNKVFVLRETLDFEKDTGVLEAIFPNGIIKCQKKGRISDFE